MTYRELIEEGGGRAYISSDAINSYVFGVFIIYREELFFLTNEPNWNGKPIPYEHKKGYKYSWAWGLYTELAPEDLPEDVHPWTYPPVTG